MPFFDAHTVHQGSDLLFEYGKWQPIVSAPPDRLRDNRHMVKSVEGIYRNGKVDLAEPLDEAEGSRVVVTWVSPASVD